jgi:Tol biopolymer transport system component
MCRATRPSKEKQKMTRVGFLTSFVVMTAALTAGLALAGRPAGASFPGQNGLIVFASDRTTGVVNPSGDSEIFTMKPDGTGIRQLTFNTASDSVPAFSADGRRIVFRSNRDGNDEIYAMNSDGSEQRRITLNAAFDSDPTFSPDGTRIAFRRSGFGGDGEIFTIDSTDGSGQRQLTDDGVDEGDPAFSPDGKTIAFEKRPQGLAGDFEIFTMDSSDGSDARQFTFNSTADIDSTFSPDGSKIAFTNLGGLLGDSEIFDVSASDASGLRPLTDNGTPDFYPAYSPDGTRVVFQSRRGSLGEEIIAIAASNGDGATNITNAPGNDSSPDWQPNTAPTFSKLRPAANSETTDRTPLIQATVRDRQTELRGSAIALSLDGVKGFVFFYDRDTDRLSFTPGSNLPLGRHTITLTATDEAGLSKNRQWSFRVVRAD